MLKEREVTVVEKGCPCNTITIIGILNYLRLRAEIYTEENDEGVFTRKILLDRFLGDSLS